jgi:hypothetical protein
MDPIVLRVMERYICSNEVTSVIRKEKGEYCVRSPNNPNWNGGCYHSKEKAEERLRQVEYFKHKSAACNFIFRVALQKGVSFDKLKSMSQAELEKLGLGVWNEPKDGVATMLFPAGWYKEIPAGFEVVDIFGEKEKFQPGKSDNEQRMGFLPYGIEVKVARRFIRESGILP